MNGEKINYSEGLRIKDKKYEADPVKPVRLVVFGDSKGKDEGINRKVVKEIINGINKLEPVPDYVIALGDMIAGSKDIEEQETQLRSFKALISEAVGIDKVFPVLGNHEVSNGPSLQLEQVFENAYKEFRPHEILKGYNKTVYCVNIYNIRLIFLNSCHYGEDRRITGTQLEWLNRILMGNQNIKILFVHIPAYPTGAHIGTCLDYYPEYRDRLWKVIDKNNTDLVFSGHEHNYSRRLIDNSFNTKEYQFNNKINQIITGGGGEKLRDKFKDKRGVIVPPKAVHHFVVIDFDNKGIRVKAITTEGKTIDDFSIEANQNFKL